MKYVMMILATVITANFANAEVPFNKIKCLPEDSREFTLTKVNELSFISERFDYPYPGMITTGLYTKVSNSHDMYTAQGETALGHIKDADLIAGKNGNIAIEQEFQKCVEFGQVPGSSQGGIVNCLKYELVKKVIHCKEI